MCATRKADLRGMVPVGTLELGVEDAESLSLVGVLCMEDKVEGEQSRKWQERNLRVRALS